MAGKNPAFSFYPNDWARDLEEHPLEIEGAWIRIVCKLWWSETKGKLTRTIYQWARILRESEEDTIRILKYLNDEKIADVTNCSKNVTVVSRKMNREYNAKYNNKLRQRKFKGNARSNDKITPPSSNHSNNSKDSTSIQARNVMDYFKKKSGNNYWSDDKQIKKALAEGLTESECIEMIDAKYNKDQRPTSLFSDKNIAEVVKLKGRK